MWFVFLSWGTMEHLLQVLTYLTVVSVAAERSVEILKKGILEKLIKKPVVYQVASAFFGFGLCLASPPDLKFLQLNEYIVSAIVGLAVSGGSGMWHDILSVITQFKENTKQTTKE
jgi:hypothetical protein